MSKNTKQPKRQPEPCYIGEDGQPHDDGLHDEMLNNADADAAFQNLVRGYARERGVSEATIKRLYGPFS